MFQAHADVNAGTVTPLIAAAYAGSTDCIKCLLKAGADANIPDQTGRVPIEFAATQRWKECVDVLFPVTTPLVKVADWSTTGIIEHSKPMSSKPQDENDGSDFEAQGDAAIGKSNYAHTLTVYTMAVEINPDDSTLYAKRSLCSLHAGDKSKALDDANIYKDMQPELSKSRSEQAAALILVKEYDRAVEVLMTGLRLDFERKPTDKAFRKPLLWLVQFFWFGSEDHP
ncbi:small glutamine-rich tetratricopeptide repeat-containing protein 2-like isoform X2 [Miscanthus floridulus]|uniref:small glutamine-rich tetratricopeptide repeat-containing protein 2-like isoform X2 n=1 Tax=Miscanthus floridulus TaxID=154761 RepID=UPI003458C66B